VVIGAAAPANEPRLRVSPNALTLHLSATSTPKGFPYTTDRRTASLRALAGFLHQRAAQLKAAGRWGVIHLEVGDTLRLDKVVRVLDALRHRPGTRPDACRFTLPPGSTTWTLPAATKTGCLLPHPVLHVGPRPARAPAPPAKAPPG
jgi:hypothetical protein